MTRKHFRTLAADLGRARSLMNNDAERAAFDRAVDSLIPTLYDVNGRFLRDTFTEAIEDAEQGCRERRAVDAAAREARLAADRAAA